MTTTTGPGKEPTAAELIRAGLDGKTIRGDSAAAREARRYLRGVAPTPAPATEAADV